MMSLWTWQNVIVVIRRMFLAMGVSSDSVTGLEYLLSPLSLISSLGRRTIGYLKKKTLKYKKPLFLKTAGLKRDQQGPRQVRVQILMTPRHTRDNRRNTLRPDPSPTAVFNKRRIHTAAISCSWKQTNECLQQDVVFGCAGTCAGISSIAKAWRLGNTELEQETQNLTLKFRPKFREALTLLDFHVSFSGFSFYPVMTVCRTMFSGTLCVRERASEGALLVIIQEKTEEH